MSAWELEEQAKNEGDRKKRMSLLKLAQQARDDSAAARGENPEHVRLRRVTCLVGLVIFSAVILILGAALL
jgi:hypothetical protein